MSRQLIAFAEFVIEACKAGAIKGTPALAPEALAFMAQRALAAPPVAQGDDALLALQNLVALCHAPNPQEPDKLMIAAGNGHAFSDLVKYAKRVIRRASSPAPSFDPGPQDEQIAKLFAQWCPQMATGPRATLNLSVFRQGYLAALAPSEAYSIARFNREHGRPYQAGEPLVPPDPALTDEQIRELARKHCRHHTTYSSPNREVYEFDGSSAIAFVRAALARAEP